MVALLIEPKGVRSIGFPKTCSRLLFPEISPCGWGNGNG